VLVCASPAAVRRNSRSDDDPPAILLRICGGSVFADGGGWRDTATRTPEMKTYALPNDDVDALAAYPGTLKK
jgi:hypothetical protein